MEHGDKDDLEMLPLKQPSTNPWDDYDIGENGVIISKSHPQKSSSIEILESREEVFEARQKEEYQEKDEEETGEDLQPEDGSNVASLETDIQGVEEEIFTMEENASNEKSEQAIENPKVQNQLQDLYYQHFANAQLREYNSEDEGDENRTNKNQRWRDEEEEQFSFEVEYPSILHQSSSIHLNNGILEFDESSIQLTDLMNLPLN